MFLISGGGFIFSFFRMLDCSRVSSERCRIRPFFVEKIPRWRRLKTFRIRSQVCPVSISIIRTNKRANQHKVTWDRIRSSLRWYIGLSSKVVFSVLKALSTSKSCLYPRAISSAVRVSSLEERRYLPANFSSSDTLDRLISNRPLLSSLTYLPR